MLKKINLLIADDHDLFRKGLIRLLKDHEQFACIGEAQDGEDFLNKYFRLQPDVSLVDIVMPKLNGIESFLRIKKKDNSAKILFLSVYSDEKHILAVMKAGGGGLISKKVAKDELIHAINEIAEGRQYFGRDLNHGNIENIKRQLELLEINTEDNGKTKLHPREEEVSILYGSGKSTKEIAEILFVSIAAIDFHRRNIKMKLQIKSFTEFITRATLHWEKQVAVQSLEKVSWPDSEK